MILVVALLGWFAGLLTAGGAAWLVLNHASTPH